MNFEQGRIFLVFFILGLLSAILFDIFRIFRKNIKTNYFLTSIEDFVYISIIGYLFLRSLIVFCNGNIRFYIFFAFFIGIIVYILTLKKFCDIIISILIKTIICVIKTVFIPIKILFEQFKGILKKLNSFKIKNGRKINEKNI